MENPLKWLLFSRVMYHFQVKRDAVASMVIVGLLAFTMLAPVDSVPPSYFATSGSSICELVSFPCRLAAATHSPAFIQSVLLISIIGAFIAAPTYIYWFTKGKRFDAMRANGKLMALGWIFILLALFPFYPGGERITPSRLELLLHLLSQTRIGLAIFSIFMFLGELAFLLLCAVWLKCLFTKNEK